MLDTNTVHKRTSLPRTKTYTRQPRAIDIHPKTSKQVWIRELPLEHETEALLSSETSVNFYQPTHDVKFTKIILFIVTALRTCSLRNVTKFEVVYQPGTIQSLWGQTAGRTTGVLIPAVTRDFLFSIRSRRSLGSTQHPTRWIPRPFPWERGAGA